MVRVSLPAMGSSALTTIPVSATASAISWSLSLSVMTMLYPFRFDICVYWCVKC